MTATSSPRITRARLRCLACDDIIESTHRHDFRSCKCRAAFIDGGLAYERYGAYSLDLVELMYEYAND